MASLNFSLVIEDLDTGVELHE